METKQTAVQLILDKFSLLSDGDFKYWMINNYDELIEMEREQIIESFMEGTKMHNINDELSARFNACIYYGEKFGEKFGGKDE